MSGHGHERDAQDQTDDLDALSTEELREHAFSRAERHADIGFFWDLVKHLPAAAALSSEDGSAGAIGGSVAEVVRLVRELAGHDYGEAEPLLRAKFIAYLQPNRDPTTSP
ncbi:MAG: hypothetical protein ACR2LJ_04115 [Acidimicrobiales bacterium]